MHSVDSTIWAWGVVVEGRLEARSKKRSNLGQGESPSKWGAGCRKIVVDGKSESRSCIDQRD